MRYLFLLCLLLPLSLFAQKEDYVWCFGDSLGLDFNDLKNPKIIRTDLSLLNENGENISPMIESCVSISRNEGNLLFYAKNNNWLSLESPLSYLIDGNQNKITNSDSILMDYSSTNGSIVIFIKNKYFLLTRIERDAETLDYLPGLYLTELEYDPQQQQIFLKYKNKQIIRDFIDEKIAAVKHANGVDWWILAHKNDYMNDTFYTYLLNEDGIKLHYKQKIGSIYSLEKNNYYWTAGEMCFAPNGSKLLAVTIGGVIDVFDFDRCTGELSNWLNLSTPPIPHFPFFNEYYGASFSPNGRMIYVSKYASDSALFQYDLKSENVKKSRFYIQTDLSLIKGQHELGPDGKIYITLGSGTIISYLGVIHNPNLAGKACNFNPSSISISRKISLGLPNFPNYRLKALGSAYTGIEKLHRICSADSVQLGYGFSEPHFIYQWQPTIGLSDPNISAPKASPAFSLTYTLTVRPDPNDPPTCTVRDSHSDTVRVEVIEKHVPPCTSVSRPEIPKPFFKVYPNPATDFVQFHYQMKETDFAQVDVYNIQGIKVKSLTLTAQEQDLLLDVKDLSAGAYLCKITHNAKAYETLKLIIE
jgi:hypothetical protein